MWMDFLVFCAETLVPALGWVGLVSLATGLVLAAAPRPRRGR